MAARAGVALRFPPMRGFARDLFTVCSAGSLLLCVAVCAGWVRSYWRLVGARNYGVGTYVEVETAPQQFEKRPIQTGLSDGINIEVVAGLTAEDKVKRR